jgi:hypothetical protein
MADAEEKGVGEEFAAIAFMSKDSTFDMLAADEQFFQTGFKEYGAAEGEDFFPDGGNDAFKTVCADMRFLVDENIRGGTVGNEGFQN